MGWPPWVLEDVIARRPAIRVNQLGYLPGQPLQATLVSERSDAVDFAVIDEDGTVVSTGRSQPWPIRPEPGSALTVHTLESAGIAAPGSCLRLTSAGFGSHPFRVAEDIYAGLFADSLRVFRLMRSGIPVTEDVLPGYSRPAGHVNTPPNSGDAAVAAWTGPEAERLYPGWHCEGTFDVSGGWYDAGDYGKYMTSGSIACWQLLGILDFLPPSTAPDSIVTAVREECRWQLDWMLRMQMPAREPLPGMAFHRIHGTAWPPLPGLPHDDPTLRVLHRPSTAATFHLASVAAHGARQFREADPTFADRLMAAATRAYDAAIAHPNLLAPDDHALFGGGPYPDEDPSDDHYWASAELWIATHEARYLEQLAGSAWHNSDVFDLDGFDFDRVAAPGRLDLALHGFPLPGLANVRDSVIAAADRLLTVAAGQPWGQPYAPDAGWGWGSNGRLLNNLVVIAVASLLTDEERYRAAVAAGMSYLLGRNPLGQSYITGYGTDDTRHQRTRQFGHDLDDSLPPSPPGALAGGPNSQPHPDFPYDDRLRGLPAQCCYVDEPTSEVTNDICIRWNAPLTYIAAFLTYRARRR
ncbi:glycoside hydrolase family 9 protein [Microbacterium sp. zg-YB36]|uniref:glycoside hydrolase family 9 protein n=1 Tax=Microbacterium sp. zg-YB36 TaxID=2969407 RepID=UPI00214C900D|nr:glycoside hydrolase family 9 protein [Microbacterium sp. zg-YB36]MDL5352739.1 glycoside hydrolase family 9 protein [Microbacterium sp. zg-YB36]